MVPRMHPKSENEMESELIYKNQEDELLIQGAGKKTLFDFS